MEFKFNGKQVTFIPSEKGTAYELLPSEVKKQISSLEDIGWVYCTHKSIDDYIDFKKSHILVSKDNDRVLVIKGRLDENTARFGSPEYTKDGGTMVHSSFSDVVFSLTFTRYE